MAEFLGLRDLPSLKDVLRASLLAVAVSATLVLRPEALFSV